VVGTGGEVGVAGQPLDPHARLAREGGGEDRRDGTTRAVVHDDHLGVARAVQDAADRDEGHVPVLERRDDDRHPRARL
jgi:hypothetical protein